MQPDKSKLSSWKKLSTKVVYKNPWMQVREDKVIRPNGQPGIYGYMENTSAVFIMALTDKNEIYLVKQQRYTIAAETLELPAGSSEGQDLLLAAKRELKEETGLVAKKWDYVGMFLPMVAVSSETNHLFLARDLTQTKQDKKSEDGITGNLLVPFSEVLEMIEDGRIISGPAITSIIKAALYLGIVNAEKI